MVLKIFAILLTSAAVHIASGINVPMTALEFEKFTQGRTLTYRQNGTPYGTEQYIEGRRVRWSFLDGECSDGSWYPEADMICFSYANDEPPQCWRFYAKGDALIAELGNILDDPRQYEAHDAAEPLLCLGPEIGV